jgi:hypothetical protein
MIEWQGIKTSEATLLPVINVLTVSSNGEEFN